MAPFPELLFRFLTMITVTTTPNTTATTTTTIIIVVVSLPSSFTASVGGSEIVRGEGSKYCLSA